MTKFGCGGYSGNGEVCGGGYSRFGVRGYSGNDDGRHTARSRSIHLGAPRALDSKLVRWQAEMDSATARGMTKFGCGGYSGNGEVCGGGYSRFGVRNCPWNDDGRHTARSRSIHLGAPRALDSRLVRWQAEMDSATARGMTKFGCGGYSWNDDGRHAARSCSISKMP